jgi:hypothetical protein
MLSEAEKFPNVTLHFDHAARWIWTPRPAHLLCSSTDGGERVR